MSRLSELLAHWSRRSPKTDDERLPYRQAVARLLVAELQDRSGVSATSENYANALDVAAADFDRADLEGSFRALLAQHDACRDDAGRDAVLLDYLSTP